MVLTQKDLDAIKDLVGVTIDEVMEKKLDEKLKNFPSKDEFSSKMDEVMSELKELREKTTVTTHQVKKNTDNIINIRSKIATAISS